MEVGDTESGRRENVDPDNPDQQMIHHCMQRRSRILNPIIDWEDADVWEFIKTYNIPYCGLYDEGYKRLGCIGCPMANLKAREEEFERFPTYKHQYLVSFEKMIEVVKNKGIPTTWNTAEEVFEWWMQR